MTEEATVLRRHLERERRARKAAEELLEEKSYQLYQANVALRKAAGQLEERVEERTIELLTANAKLQDEIVARARVEQELAHARDLALQASRLKSEFLATMSHEIRTPMNGITGMTEILLETELDEEQREYVTIVFEESHKLLEIINSILDLSKIEAGKIILEEVEFDPVNEIWGVLRLFTAKADAKGITLRYTSTSNLPALIVGDALRLRQILTNLISNAVKFTQEGEVTLSVSRHQQGQSTLPQRDERAEFQFVIEDTGIGMSPAVLQNLFTPFTQADSSTTRRYGGTGLGLAITKRLVDLVGGQLQVESQPTVGSKFTLILPYRLKEVALIEKQPTTMVAIGDGTPTKSSLVTAGTTFVPPVVAIYSRLQEYHPWQNGTTVASSEFATQANHVPLDHRAESQRKGKAVVAAAPLPKQILLVEDYRNNQLVALAHLKKLGYDADVAENGQAAIDQLIAHGEQYQLVLMDWQMPVMDGLETTRLIRKMEGNSGQHIPIIGMTANAIKGDRERCLEAGMDDYLAKPIHHSELSRILALWLSPTKSAT